jgi:hypothetical protein
MIRLRFWWGASASASVAAGGSAKPSIAGCTLAARASSPVMAIANIVAYIIDTRFDHSGSLRPAIRRVALQLAHREVRREPVAKIRHAVGVSSNVAQPASRDTPDAPLKPAAMRLGNTQAVAGLILCALPKGLRVAVSQRRRAWPRSDCLSGSHSRSSS